MDEYRDSRNVLARVEATPEPYSGNAFMYVLAMAGPEDMLKVGMTRDPLARWSAFHPRWFEAFDLDHSLLVETETRADAQALETALHRLLVEHQCPVPMTMRSAAGGATEWYRGAYSAARKFMLKQELAGYIVHIDARSQLERPMAVAREQLFSVVNQAFEDRCSGWLSAAQLEVVHDMVDAQRAFFEDIKSVLPPHVCIELGLHV